MRFSNKVIGTVNDEEYMRLALEEAKRASEDGEVPVGAVVVGADGAVIVRARNTREADNDPTAHAETKALREAAKKLGRWRLTDETLYVTKEPCVMCAGVMVNARLKKVVYACKDPKGGAAGSVYDILNDGRLNHKVETVTSVLEAECAVVLRGFFRMRRGG